MGDKKILVFLPNGCGGAERMSVYFASSLRQYGYDPTYIVLGTDDNYVRGIIEDDSEVILERIRKISYGGLFRICRMVWKYRPEVVFSSFYYLNFRVILAAKSVRGTRSVVRSDNTFSSQRFYVRILSRVLYKRADAIIAQTDQMKSEICRTLKVNPDLVYVLKNPVRVRIIEKKLEGCSNPYPADGQKNFVSVCRVTAQKALDVLIRAFAIVHQKNERTRLTIVGDYQNEPVLMENLRAMIASFNIEESVVFTGYLSNPYPYVKYSDCFVLASNYEGMPNALIEANYLRVPSVSTLSVPAIRDIIDDGHSGFIVPVGDYVSLADSMLKALDLRDVPNNYFGSEPEQFLKIVEGFSL